MDAVLAGAVAGAVSYVLAPSGDDSSSRNADVCGVVKSSMQLAFDTDSRFAPCIEGVPTMRIRLTYS
ncbi:MAG: hypothetical protein QOI79_34 [Mycobacterium sp.]|nr:hypothetical protein [Mycobacterium sp.]